jgi:hypothetical protein
MRLRSESILTLSKESDMKKPLLAGVALIALSASALAGPPERPIRVGGAPGLNACSSSGTIKVNSFVSVRTGPGVQYAEKDRVYDGQLLAICDWNEDQSWFGVIYIPGGSAYDNSACFGLSIEDQAHRDDYARMWDQARPYTGPCRFGWLSKRYTKDLAG